MLDELHKSGVVNILHSSTLVDDDQELKKVLTPYLHQSEVVCIHPDAKQWEYQFPGPAEQIQTASEQNNNKNNSAESDDKKSPTDVPGSAGSTISTWILIILMGIVGLGA